MVNSFPPQISHSFPGWPWVKKCFLLWGRPLSPCGFSQERVHCSTSWGCTRVRCFSPRQFFKWTFRTVIPSAVSHMAPSWCLQPHEYLPPNPLWHVRMSFRGWGWPSSLGQQVPSLDSPWAHLLAGAFSDALVYKGFPLYNPCFSSCCPSQSLLPSWPFHWTMGALRKRTIWAQSIRLTPLGLGGKRHKSLPSTNQSVGVCGRQVSRIFILTTWQLPTTLSPGNYEPHHELHRLFSGRTAFCLLP